MTVPDATPDREFTPSMERLRDEYVQMRAEHYGFSDLYAAEFDRALAQRDSRIRAEALREARAIVERQTDLTELVHFERPSDFRKGVLTCLAALDAAIKEAQS